MQRTRSTRPVPDHQEGRSRLPSLPTRRAGRAAKALEPAEQFFRQALDLDPANAMTLNYLGYMLADKGTKLPKR